MKNAFTTGKKKKRTALRCVSNRIVSQSRACGIYYHHGNGKGDGLLAAMKSGKLP